MNVYWTPSSGAARYSIDRETVTNGLWTTNFATSTSTNYPDTSYTNTGFRYRVSAVNSAGGTSTPSGVFPLPRYALIDLGTNFMPVGISTNGIVAGNIYDNTAGTFWGEASAGGAIWQTGGPVQRLTDSLCIQGINSAGQMVGQNTNNDAVIWTSATSPDTIKNSSAFAISNGVNYTGATSISDTGLVVGFAAEDSPTHGIMAAQFSTAGTDSPLLTDQIDSNGNPVYQAYASAAGGTHWAGMFQYGATGGFTNDPTQESGFVIDGNKIPITGLWFDWDEPAASDIASLYRLNGINASGTAVGVTSQGAVAYSGSPPTATVLGQGEALAVNTSGQIVGVDSAGAFSFSPGSFFRNGNALLWEMTNYAGTPTTNYVQKSLNDLLPDANGMLVNAATGINNQGVIVGTYSSGVYNSSYNPVNAHGVMLLPLQLRLLNGSTPDFDGTTPKSYIQAPENPGYAANLLYSGGVANFGAAPMGTGAASPVTGYFCEVQVAARAPATISSIQYRWKRYVIGRVWYLGFNGSVWTVKNRNTYGTQIADAPWGTPDDGGALNFIPNSINQEFYYGDGPGIMYPATGVNDSSYHKGDFIHQENCFTYVVQFSLDGVNWQNGATLQIQQSLSAQYKQNYTGVASADLQGIANGVVDNSLGNVIANGYINPYMTPAKAALIVGSTNINMDANANAIGN